MTTPVVAPWVRSPARIYAPDDEAVLLDELATISAHTLVVSVAEPDDLRLDYRGQVRGDLRYTLTGLRQVLSSACPGAFRLVTELAGRRDGPELLDASLPAAVDVFNRVIEARFARLAERCQLAHNLQDRTIDGVLGPAYVLYLNDDFLTTARSALESGDELVFAGASCSGRRLVARYRRREPLGHVALADQTLTLYQGWHLANAELGGEAAVQVTPAVLDSLGGAALLKFTGGRVRHTGRRFHDKLARALARAATVELPAASLDASLRQLAQVPLRAAGGFRRDLLARLRQQGLPAKLARRILLAAESGSVSGDALAAPRASVSSTASQLTLFSALCNCGLTLHHPAREAAERAAAALLHGSL